MAAHDEHPAQKRQQIIHGAETVFTECGYEGASMSRIALQAAVSKGTLYNYFTGKSDLFAAFVSQKAHDTLTEMFEPIAEPDDLGAILRQIAQRMVAMMMSPGSLVLYRIVISEAGKFPDLARIYWESGPQRVLAHTAGWLVQQMQAGRLRQADPEVAADQFFALCQTAACMKRRLQMLPPMSSSEIEVLVGRAVHMFLQTYDQGPRDVAPQDRTRMPKPLAGPGPDS